MQRIRDKKDQSFWFDSESAVSLEDDLPFVYEQIIQKLEGDIRNHIKVENQLKLILGT